MTPEEHLRRAAGARVLLEDDTFKEAFSTVRAECLRQWEASPARDTEGRERLWTMVKLLDRVHGHIKSVAENGKLVQKRLDEIEQNKIHRLFSR